MIIYGHIMSIRLPYHSHDMVLYGYKQSYIVIYGYIMIIEWKLLDCYNNLWPAMCMNKQWMAMFYPNSFVHNSWKLKNSARPSMSIPCPHIICS